MDGMERMRACMDCFARRRDLPAGRMNLPEKECGAVYIHGCAMG